MPDTKISQLGSGDPFQASDLLVIARGANNFKVTPPSLDQLAAVHAVGADVPLNGHKITNLGTPTLSTDAVTKAYADAIVAAGAATLANVLVAGNDAGSLSITNLADPVGDADAATKEYVDNLAFSTVTATAYTLALADRGTVLNLTGSTPITVTIPTDATTSFPVGAVVMLRQFTTGGTVTVAGAAGVTIESRGNSYTLAGQFAVATLVRLPTTNHWWMFGDLL